MTVLFRMSHASPVPSEKSSLRIVLAEDLEAVREVYADLLGRAGHTVDAAADGQAAWELMQTTSYDILVTDHMMPRLSGVELLRLVRKEHTDLPVVLISGDLPLHESDLVALTTPGVLLPKPFSRAELLSAVEIAVRRAADCQVTA